MQSLDDTTGLPRFNMLFELGLFVGCRHFSSDGEQNSKDFLVLDSAPQRFRDSLSDFAGYDIACHHGSPGETVQLLRDWLANSRAQITYGGVKLQADFRAFEADLPTLATDFAPHPDQITYSDLCHLIRTWII